MAVDTANDAARAAAEKIRSKSPQMRIDDMIDVIAAEFVKRDAEVVIAAEHLLALPNWRCRVPSDIEEAMRSLQRVVEGEHQKVDERFKETVPSRETLRKWASTPVDPPDICDD